jgi:hypothetical protein
MPQTTVSTASSGSPATLFASSNSVGPCSSYYVENTDASRTLFVQIPGLHETVAQAVPLSPGASMAFGYGGQAITSVLAWLDSASSVTVNHGKVQAK